MSDMAISPSRKHYVQDGYFIQGEPIFPVNLINEAVAGMDAVRNGTYDTGRTPHPSIWNPGDDVNKLCKIEQPQFASQAILDLLRFPALGALAAEITGASMVQIFWVQLLYKPSSHIGALLANNIGWHQDRAYWGIWEEGSELFTAWIALSDVREECGPMRFVPGSHRWGLIPAGDFWAQDLAGQQSAIPIPPGETWREALAILPPGGVSFHDNYTLHGSGPNYSGAPRRSLAVHMRTQNSRPVEDRRIGLAEFIDDPALCPVVYRKA